MGKLYAFKPTSVPKQFQWALNHCKANGPAIVREAFKLYGLKEIQGANHSEEILDMAAALGGVIEKFYTSDEIPWCGLAVSYWIKQAGFDPPKDYSQVRARDFVSWGNPASRPSFGDVLVFWRGSPAGRDGHVGLYIAEDKESFYVLGGNQGNEVNIARMLKTRLLSARRCPWRVSQPAGVKPFLLNAGGAFSENEA